MKRKKMSACLPLFPHLTKINMWRRKRKRQKRKKERSLEIDEGRSDGKKDTYEQRRKINVQVSSYFHI